MSLVSEAALHKIYIRRNQNTDLETRNGGYVDNMRIMCINNLILKFKVKLFLILNKWGKFRFVIV